MIRPSGLQRDHAGGASPQRTSKLLLEIGEPSDGQPAVAECEKRDCAAPTTNRCEKPVDPYDDFAFFTGQQRSQARRQCERQGLYYPALNMYFCDQHAKQVADALYNIAFTGENRLILQQELKNILADGWAS